MITNKIEFEYKNHKIEEFSTNFVAGEFEIETGQFKITLDEFHFEELRRKLNKLHDEVN